MSFENARAHLRMARVYYAKHDKASVAYTRYVKNRARELLRKDLTGQLAEIQAELLAAREPKAKEHLGNEQMYSRWADLEATMAQLEAMEEQWPRQEPGTPYSTTTGSS